MSTNLVARPSRFIGRAQDLASLDAAFAEARLVTLAGPGGVGKTRLAIEYGLSRLAGPAPVWKEAWFCDLSEARDHDDVCMAVAQGLDVALGAGGDAAGLLGRVLAQRPGALLILDNLEQVAAQAAAIVGTWLGGGGAGARFLVTSRERLHLASEVTLAVEPLTVPDEMPGDSEAVALLQDRLRVLRFAGAEDVASMSEIARRLDGIPLALELAASRIAVFGAEAVAARLERGLDVLGRSSRDAAARQATMARTIEWSWDLLQPWEQDALTQCAIFRGGFSLDATEAVVDLSSHPQAPPVMDVVQALAAKSLIRASAAGTEPRFDLYQVVRAFVRDRRGAGAAAALARHAAHFARLGETLSSQLDGAQGSQAMRRLALERDNLAAVLERSVGPAPDPATALRVALALGRFHAIRGPLSLQVRRLDAALGANRALEVEAGLATKALLARGNTRRILGGVAEGHADLEVALERARRAGDRALEGEALADLSATAIQEARFDQALALAQEAVVVLTPLGAGAALAKAQSMVANAHHHQGRVDLAARAFEEALVLYRAAGHRRGEGIMLSALAGTILEDGRCDEAIELAERAIAIHRDLGDRWEAQSQLALALARIDRLDWARARETLAEAIQVARATGDLYVEAVCLGYGGILAWVGGAPAEGVALLERSLEVASWGVAGSLLRGFLGGVLATMARVDRAAELLDQAERELLEGGNVLLLETVRLQRGLLELALASRAEASDDAVKATALRKAARARVEGARVSPSGRSLASRSVEVRLALGILERAMGIGGGDAPPDGAPALIVDASGRWFVGPGGERVDCRRRALHGRLLLALAHKRLREPGEPLRVPELVKIGWPDERILPDAAKNRLYVALSRLRGLGLAGVLIAEGDGYLLDPAVPVRLVSE